MIRERPNGEPETQREYWPPGDGTAYEADLVLMDRTTAEPGRASIHPHPGRRARGRTNPLRPVGVKPIPTGPTYSWNGREMVKVTTFEPEEATRLLGTPASTGKSRTTRSAARSCVQLQASMEHALKALTIALGERV